MFKRATKRDSVSFPGQHADEEVVSVVRQHPVVLRRPLIAFLGIIALSSLALMFPALGRTALYILLGGFGLAAVIFAYFFISWYFSVYIITNERLIQIKQRGLFDRRVVDIAHNRIQSVNYEIKGVQATMFKFGTIIVQTFVGDLILRYIHNPADVQQQLVKIVRTVTPVSPAEMRGEASELQADEEDTKE